MVKSSNMEHFKETDISGLFVGSNGTIKNDTGIRMYLSFIKNDVYIVMIITERKRVYKKLSTLIYQYHINRGRPIDPDMTVKFKDYDPNNLEIDNLYIDVKNGFRNYRPIDPFKKIQRMFK